MKQKIGTVIRLLFLWTACAQPVVALDLPSGATLQAETNDANGQLRLATAGYDGSAVSTRDMQGHVLRQAWKLNAGDLSSFELLKTLRDQLTEGGFELLYSCQSVSCGGYDFRFDMGHFKAPDMFVDLGDYHYLSAIKDNEAASVLVSRMTSDAYVELMQLAPTGQELGRTTTSANTGSGTSVKRPQGSLAGQLEQAGRVVLDGLSFATGSSKLADGEFTSLAELATYLSENSDRKVTLVGHTDAEGSLEGNVALSRKRAASVMNRLVNLYAVNPAQLSADGVGYLSPLYANLTEQAREANRRVEAVLISTE